MHHHPNFPPSLSITPNKTLGCANGFSVEAQREAISRYGIAGRVWEAAYALCAYVDPSSDIRAFEFDPPFVEDPHTPLGVIELGSGTGMVAASIARVVRRATIPGGFVIATDLPDVCPLLQHNLGIRPSMDDTAVFVRPLAWGDPDHVTAVASELSLRRWSHVVCSDLVYFPELLGPLLRTLVHLTSPPCVPPLESPVKVVISYKIRSLSKETPFWSAFGLWFSFQPVLARRQIWVRSLDDIPDAPEPWTRLGANGDTDQTFVFVAHRRPESFAWHVPETDKELMEGVGAQGTTTNKGDDTFETILFMGIGIDDTGE